MKEHGYLRSISSLYVCFMLEYTWVSIYVDIRGWNASSIKEFKGDQEAKARLDGWIRDERC